jgi:hypothetical protein
MDADIELTRQTLRTPRAAGFAGVVFALLFGTVIVLARRSVPADPNDAGEWLTDEGRRDSVTLALNLLPFAGIAFLWFIGVVREQLGPVEDRLFSTVFFGSGLLFLGMLFLGAVNADTMLQMLDDAKVNADVWNFGRGTTQTLVSVYAMRMAAVFTLSVSTVALRASAFPRWVSYLGYAVSLSLLVAAGEHKWTQLLFPTWVLVLSIVILFTSPPSPDTD